MSSTLSVTLSITSDGQWRVRGTIASGTLPTNIFIYENTGETTLGEYVGVADLSEFQRLKTWTGTAIPLFGNRFVLHTEADKKVATQEEALSVKNNMIKTVKMLSNQFATENLSSSTENVAIP